MRTLHLLAAPLFCVAALLVGCERSPSAPSSSSEGGSSAPTATPTTAPTAGASGTATPRPAGKKLVVGYSQIGAESAWRTANSESIKSEAEKRGIDLRFADAQQRQENQIKALRSFLQQRVDVIMLSPVVETGWEPVLREIKAANIPVILSDRRVATSDE